MRVLFVSPFSSAPTLVNRSIPILRALEDLGYQVDIYLPHNTTPNALTTIGQEKFWSVSDRPTSPHGVLKGIHESFKWLARPSVGRVFFPIAGTDEFGIIWQGLRSLISKKDNYDLILVSKPWLRSAGLGLWLGKRWEIPVVLDMDDYDISEGSYLLAQFDGIVVSSHELGKLFKSYSPLYLPNSTDLEIFDPKRFAPRRTNECVIVWSGIMYDYIRLENLILALSKMREDASILFSGDGPKKSRLIRLAESLGVDDRIIFSEWGKRSAVPERLAKADIGIVYSSKTRFQLCKCPGKLFEYMAMKLPIITTNIGEAAETIRRASCGLEVPPDDPDSLASALDYLTQNPDLRKRMGESGRNYLLNSQSFSTLASSLSEYFSRVVVKTSGNSN
jgi:glycosyltransferase involved in cell wall biosynthesis